MLSPPVPSELCLGRHRCDKEFHQSRRKKCKASGASSQWPCAALWLLQRPRPPELRHLGVRYSIGSMRTLQGITFIALFIVMAMRGAGHGGCGGGSLLLGSQGIQSGCVPTPLPPDYLQAGCLALLPPKRTNSKLTQAPHFYALAKASCRSFLSWLQLPFPRPGAPKTRTGDLPIAEGARKTEQTHVYNSLCPSHFDLEIIYLRTEPSMSKLQI